MAGELTAIISLEGDAWMALCPALGLASQGVTVEVARKNLSEAVALFLEFASGLEIERRLHSEAWVTRVRVASG